MNRQKTFGTRETGLMLAMVRSMDILNRYLQIELAKYGTNPAKFSVMNALLTHGGKMTPTAISKWVFRAKHSITEILKPLCENNLVCREPSLEDGRSVNIIITEKGWKASEEIYPGVDYLSKEALSCFSDKELETLMELLKRFRKHLLIKINQTDNLKNKANTGKLN